MCNNHEPTKRGDVIRKVAALTIGVIFCQAAYFVVLTLQTSINISAGLGSATITTTYVTAGVSGLFFTPLMLQHLGAKVSILICDAFYFIYTLANFYPRYFTLIPAALLNGFGEASMMPTVMLFSSQFAHEYARFGPQDVETYTTQLTGIVFSSLFLSGIFGYSLSQAIFFGGSSAPAETYSANSSMPTVAPFVRNLSFCGRNDCQDPNVITINYENYRPASEFLLNILFGVMASLIAVAFILHATLLGTYVPPAKLKNADGFRTDGSEGEEKDFNEDSDSPYKISKKENFVDKMVATAKAVYLQLSNPRQLLIVPMLTYYGLLAGLWMTEFTRAFISCIDGVEKVSMYALISTVSGACIAVSSGALIGYIGRKALFCCISVIDLAYLTMTLLWDPSEDTTWVLYLLFIGTGFSDGVWTTTSNSMVVTYFPDNKEVALSVWTLSMVIGVVWQTGWSTTLCVYQKICFQIGMLFFGMMCYGIALYVYGDGPTTQKTSKSESTADRNLEMEKM